jgi:hypothetical protein
MCEKIVYNITFEKVTWKIQALSRMIYNYASSFFTKALAHHFHDLNILKTREHTSL